MGKGNGVQFSRGEREKKLQVPDESGPPQVAGGQDDLLVLVESAHFPSVAPDGSEQSPSLDVVQDAPEWVLDQN